MVTHPLICVDRRWCTTWARCGHRLQFSALQEFRLGFGVVVVCQLHAWSGLADEPAARELVPLLLAARPRSLS